MSLKAHSVRVSALVVATGGLLFAAPKPPQPGPTPPPSTCTPVGYHSMLSAVGTIQLPALAEVPEGNCSQITLTAWRNNFDYQCQDPISAHESTTARGKSLKSCRYDLPIEMGHMVVIKATTTIPGYRVVLTYNNKSETSPSIWEEKHPVTINWLLKPRRLAPPRPPLKGERKTK